MLQKLAGLTKAMGPHVVAIIADVHFHDPTGDFGGAGVLLGGQRLALRSWHDTETGARAVNETAAALCAALDRIVAAGIRHIILAGDYTDDGQAENTRKLAQVLRSYEHAHRLRFFAIPGNHDVYGPHGKHVSTRFMTGTATSVLVTSDPEVAVEEGTETVFTPAMRCAGQPEALLPMAGFGLFRHPEDLLWESPFGASDASEARQYLATAADGSVSHSLMDASYLVEPEPGLWILMIDVNVFEPRPGRADASRKRAFLDPSNAGWTAVLRVKPFLLPWIKTVVARAKALGKTLVAVSHYPVLDPFRDNAGAEVALFGKTTVARRTPGPDVAKAMLATGLRWHASGHLHVNAVTHCQAGAGRFTDVALPSLAAFPPAYKVVRATKDVAKIETVLLTDMQTDPRLYNFYATQGHSAPPVDYDNFLAAQFRSRVVSRRLGHDWPESVLAIVKGADCIGLLRLLAAGDAAELIERHGLTHDELREYGALQMIADAYLIRTAGPLARLYLDPTHAKICRFFAQEFGDPTIDPKTSDRAFLARFLSVLQISLARMDEPEIIL